MTILRKRFGGAKFPRSSRKKNAVSPRRSRNCDASGASAARPESAPEQRNRRAGGNQRAGRRLGNQQKLAADFAPGESRGVNIHVIQPIKQVSDLGRSDGEGL